MSHEGKKTKPVPPGRILAGAEVARLIDLKFPTRNEFAYKAGLDPKKVSDLVNGRKKMDANIASQLAKLLEKDEFFFGICSQKMPTLNPIRLKHLSTTGWIKIR